MKYREILPTPFQDEEVTDPVHIAVHFWARTQFFRGEFYAYIGDTDGKIHAIVMKHVFNLTSWARFRQK